MIEIFYKIVAYRLIRLDNIKAFEKYFQRKFHISLNMWREETLFQLKKKNDLCSNRVECVEKIREKKR